MPTPRITGQQQAAIAIGIGLFFVVVAVVAAFVASWSYFTHHPLANGSSGNAIILTSLAAGFVSMALSYFVYRIAMRLLNPLAHGGDNT